MEMERQPVLTVEEGKRMWGQLSSWMKKRSKAKVKPLFAILAILMVPVLVYLRISEELRKEDQQLKRSEVEQAIVRVNAALDQEERKTEEKEIAGGKRQKFAYAKTLILDSAQIAMKCFSPEEMAECSSFLNKSHNKTLTDMDIIKMEALVAAKSPHMTNEETKKIKMLVKLLKSHPASLSKEQRAPLLQEIEDLYAGKTLKNRETDFSRILQEWDLKRNSAPRLPDWPGNIFQNRKEANSPS
jgi:hypothetical protein